LAIWKNDARGTSCVGRTVQFNVEIGQSGRTSQFFDPVAASDEPVFERADRHIETGLRRGLLVAPNRCTVGLLVTEVHGRSGVKSLLAPTLSRIFRHYTDHVLDIAAVVDEDALRQYLDAADIKEITLRRTGLPTDIADAVLFTAKDAEAGKLEMKIKTEAIALYHATGYREVPPFNDEPYTHHWFTKTIG
jgi:hypothetical protein